MTGTAIVVVNYNSAELLRRHLDRSLTSAVSDVIIVDNSPPDAHDLCALRGWSYIPLPGNPGFGAGCNAGVSLARENRRSRILLLNPDAYIDPLSLHRLEAEIDHSPTTMVAPRIVDTTGKDWFKGAKLNRILGIASHSRDGSDADWLTAACLMTSLSAFDSVGGFDESFFLYWEDVDLTFRAKRSGISLRVIDDAQAVHDVGGTQGSESGKSLVYYAGNIKGRRRFARKNLPGLMRLLWALSEPVHVVVLLRRGGLLRHPIRSVRVLRKILEL